jgi:hypothetical protein
MDFQETNYYKAPWSIQKGTFQGGQKRITIHGESGGFIADIYRKSLHSDEKEWGAIALLIALSPELLTIVEAVAENRVTDEVIDKALLIITQLKTHITQ